MPNSSISTKKESPKNKFVWDEGDLVITLPPKKKKPEAKPTKPLSSIL